ncbi:molybdenum cofactor biosynthesis protein MoaE [soil metagenome]
MTEISTGITDEPLDVAGAIAGASAPGCGGIGVFVGTVRTSAAAPGRDDTPVVRLQYEAHPSLAADKLGQVARAASERWDIHRIVAWHRSGACAIGEPTVVIACGAAHRSDALEACHWIIDTVKTTVPIWKREVYADGSSWLGAEGAVEEVPGRTP